MFILVFLLRYRERRPLAAGRLSRACSGASRGREKRHTRSGDLAEVAATGGAVSEERSAEETKFAAFWYEFSDIGWNRVRRVAARDANLDLWDSARLFALVNVAMADAYIAGWNSKMHWDFWRPVTANRRGG